MRRLRSWNKCCLSYKNAERLLSILDRVWEQSGAPQVFDELRNEVGLG
jgi:hypothetical protein